uniref:Hypothetical conserved protein n=1 Tax=Acetithermum autotrophicum TaxID=1446466 RepID=H5SQV0_ACEAU|nr:hypothetical conserved protein [Candidatus Acetothermum autotrophicum]
MKKMTRWTIGLGLALVLAGALHTAAWAQMGPPGGPGPQAGPGAQAGPMMGCQPLWNLGFPRTLDPLTIDQAVEATQKYLTFAGRGNPDLVPAKVIDFTNHFQVTVKEQSTGANAFNVVIDKLATGAVCWEPGANVLWNTKYHPGQGPGPMHGPPFGPAPTTQMTVTAERAKELAQKFLNVFLPGTTVDTEVDTFYGFYDLFVLKDGKIVGELSVDGRLGSVWYHTWHGPFVALKKL